ncbi:MAG: hypothetical protein HYV77_00685 [Candidatus Wildermuthbacteria bacterium]|nr:hypothetical protein [Candidatus Wildermuthbacteria bacterium]
MRHKVLTASVIAIAIMVITGFNAVLFAGVWDPVWNPFRPDPEKILFQSFWNLSKTKTYQSELSGSISFQSGQDKGKLSFSTKGPLDQTNKEMQLSAGIIKVDIEIGRGSEQKTISLEGELKSQGNDVLYLKATKVPKEVHEALEDAGLSNELLDKWIKIDANSLMSRYLDEEQQKAYAEQAKLQKELMEKLTKLISDPKFYDIVKTHPNEEIKGVSAYHYTVDFKSRAFANEALPIILDTVKALQANDSSFQEIPLDYAAGALQGMIDTFLLKVGPIQADVWIEKQKKLPLKITFNKTIDTSVVYQPLKGSVGIDFVFEFSDFNKPVHIEMPTDAVPIEEILDDISSDDDFFPAPLGIGSSRARDAIRISDIRQMALILETENEAQPGNYLTGCTKSGANNTATCTAPGDIKYFKTLIDPSNASPKQGSCTISTPQEGCQYAISSKNGIGRPKTNDYQICFYLENEPTDSVYQGYIKGLQAVKSGQDPLKASPCTIP